jgi:hypothetical protein
MVFLAHNNLVKPLKYSFFMVQFFGSRVFFVSMKVGSRYPLQSAPLRSAGFPLLPGLG